MEATIKVRATKNSGNGTGESAVAPEGIVDGNHQLPTHIAVIMDGNGRWAQERGLARTQGHRAGLEALRLCIQNAGDRGIRYLTIFAFSSENWSRPKSEVDDLMGLLKTFIRRDLKKLHKNGVQVRMIGNRSNLKTDILNQIEEAETLTRDNSKMTLVVAFNYGARNEIVRVVQGLVASAENGKISPEDITEELISSQLDTAGIPEPDLLIRTSGEERISNFLLWQCAYTEFVFTDIYWPDFDGQALDNAIEEYSHRNRRFGKVANVAGI
ncbi:MAG: isoprenyl transferase [Rhizobiales bacterium]|nr:isoprenyl transferase [Hyphomicrobiales bacterium]